ncbi:hypothetical protein FRB96_002799 [Tulasnella sp. 330]|nr:hypothetical protein FRB96_002799 [Tulasnella sp. 330]
MSTRSQRVSPRRLLKLLSFNKTTSHLSTTSSVALTSDISAIKPKQAPSAIVQAPTEPLPSFRAQLDVAEDSAACNIATPPLVFRAVSQLGGSISLSETDDEEDCITTPSESKNDCFDGELDVVADEGHYYSYLDCPGFCSQYTGDEIFAWLEAHTFVPVESASMTSSLSQSGCSHLEADVVDGYPYQVDVNRGVVAGEVSQVTIVYDEVALDIQETEADHVGFDLVPIFKETHAPAPVAMVPDSRQDVNAPRSSVVAPFTILSTFLSSIYGFGIYIYESPMRLYRSTRKAYEAAGEVLCSIIVYLYIFSRIFNDLKHVFEVPPAPAPVPVKSLDEFFIRIVKSLLKRATGGIVNFWVFLLIGRQLGVTMWILLPFCSFAGLVPLMDLVPTGSGSILKWNP